MLAPVHLHKEWDPIPLHLNLPHPLILSSHIKRLYAWRQIWYSRQAVDYIHYMWGLELQKFLPVPKRAAPDGEQDSMLLAVTEYIVLLVQPPTRTTQVKHKVPMLTTIWTLPIPKPTIPVDLLQNPYNSGWQPSTSPSELWPCFSGDTLESESQEHKAALQRAQEQKAAEFSFPAPYGSLNPKGLPRA